MRRRDKIVKPQRRKTLRRRNAPKAAHTTRSSADGKDKKIAQLTRERDELLEQQTATSEVLKIISSSLGELEFVFQTMLSNAVRICEAKFGVMFRYDGRAFRSVASRNVPPAYEETLRRRGSFQPDIGAPLYRLTQTKELVQTADELAEPNPGPAGKIGGARSLIAVPMRKDNNLIGAFVIYRTEIRPFSNKQIELLHNFAAQAVIAIENARLLSELRQRTDDLTESLEQQTATSEVLGVIAKSSGRLEPVFSAMLENAVRVCGAKFGMLNLYEGNGFRTVAMDAVPRAFADKRRREPFFPSLRKSHGPYCADEASGTYRRYHDSAGLHRRQSTIDGSHRIGRRPNLGCRSNAQRARTGGRNPHLSPRGHAIQR